MIGYHTALNNKAALMIDTNSYSLYKYLPMPVTNLIILDLTFYPPMECQFK